MGLFEYLVKANYVGPIRDGVATTATFTGRRRKARVYSKAAILTKNYYEYELVYIGDGKKRCVWHVFYPLPDPELEGLEGSTVRIIYSKKKPYRYEINEEGTFDSEEAMYDFEEGGEA